MPPHKHRCMDACVHQIYAHILARRPFAQEQTAPKNLFGDFEEAAEEPSVFDDAEEKHGKLTQICNMINIHLRMFVFYLHNWCISFIQCMELCVYIYIYIYRERESEREKETEKPTNYLWSPSCSQENPGALVAIESPKQDPGIIA